MLLTEALLMALHRDVAAEPPGASRLVRLPLPDQPGPGQMGPTARVVRHILMADAAYRSLG